MEHVFTSVQSLREGLHEVAESAHFTIRYLRRTPPLLLTGQGHGAVGVRDPRLIDNYLETLESTFCLLTSQEQGWPAPKTNQTGKIQVYVTGLTAMGRGSEAFTALDRGGTPFIVLPSQTQEASSENIRCRAAAEAAHELAHVFCWSVRPPLRSPIEKRWRWFNEATAVFVESLVVRNVTESNRFALRWCDYPDWSLDDDSMQLESGYFAQYLSRRFGSEIIRSIWTESLSTEGPVDVLNRLVQCSSQSAICPIFGEYAHASYFVREDFDNLRGKDLFERFEGRALTENVVVDTAATVQLVNSIDHLACRYYRIVPRIECSRLSVNVKTTSKSGTLFRSFLSAQNAKGQRVHTVELGVPPSGLALRMEDRGVLSANITRREWSRGDSLLLTVANCGLRSRRFARAGLGHDDEQTVEICLSSQE